MALRLVLYCAVAVLLCTFPAARTPPVHAGVVDGATLEIGPSDRFSESEIRSAMDRVLEKFTDFRGCRLLRLRYDEERSDRFLNGVPDANRIVLLSDFSTDEASGEDGFNTNATYEDFGWILTREGPQSDWVLLSWGY